MRGPLQRHYLQIAWLQFSSAASQGPRLGNAHPSIPCAAARPPCVEAGVPPAPSQRDAPLSPADLFLLRPQDRLQLLCLPSFFGSPPASGKAGRKPWAAARAGPEPWLPDSSVTRDRDSVIPFPTTTPSHLGRSQHQASWPEKQDAGTKSRSNPNNLRPAALAHGTRKGICF